MIADAAPAPALKAERPVPARFTQDVLWARAMNEGDDIDLAALADREGATGLLEAFEQGGQVARTALAALPFAPDAPVAYRRLGEVALLTKGETQRAIIRAAHDVAVRPRRFGEPVDEGGTELCAKALLHIANDEGAPRDNRALAVSALRLFPFSSVVGPEQVPTTFDPPPAASSVGR